jgi:hypothetical protein
MQDKLRTLQRDLLLGAFGAIELDGLRKQRTKKRCREECDPAVVEVNENAVSDFVSAFYART